MSWVLRSLPYFLLTLGLGTASAKDAHVSLRVTHAAGSEQCPSAERVFAAAARLFPDRGVRAAANSDAERLEASISIAPAPVGHEALLRVSGRRSGERRIVDPDAQCRGLADALAVALVVLSAHEEPNPGNAVRSEPPLRTPASEPTADAALERWRIGLDAGGFVGLGMLEQPALGGALGISLWAPFRVGVRVRGLRAVAQSKPLEPGETQVDLWAGMFSACYRLGREQSVWLVPCADFGWGRQHAEARGLLGQDGEVNRRWLVLGPSLALAIPLGSSFRAGATLGMSARLHDQSYSVDAEVVQQQPSLGGYALLGLQADWPISRSSRGR